MLLGIGATLAKAVVNTIKGAGAASEAVAEGAVQAAKGAGIVAEATVDLAQAVIPKARFPGLNLPPVVGNTVATTGLAPMRSSNEVAAELKLTPRDAFSAHTPMPGGGSGAVIREK